jgi:hypothetical protein
MIGNELRDMMRERERNVRPTLTNYLNELEKRGGKGMTGGLGVGAKIIACLRGSPPQISILKI